MTSIYRITPSMLRQDVLESQIYPDLARYLYWDDTWDPAFYTGLARAGFIAVAYQDPEIGPVLIPELQTSYAVLDWEKLHVSRNVRRLVRREAAAGREVELRIADSLDRVLERVSDYHDRAWTLPPYARLLRALPRTNGLRFAIHGVELWSLDRDEVVAGELGYSIGATYTSLTGFCSPEEPELRHFGTLQLILLARRLAEHGYAFWNMGHPEQAYKKALGARVISRATFLEKWLDARDRAPSRPLTS